ncbi:hypothetical protein ACEPAH_9325 [Sanghuangporus vaninii]
MPDHAKYPFSVCLQHDHETVEEYETQYSRDGRTVTCWVCDELLQRADNVRWESDGIGHPSKIRVLTERAHVTSHRSRANELRVAGLRPTVSEPYAKYRMSTERSSLRRHYSDHERLAIPTNDRILTIKIEVTMPRRVSASHASGSLPLNTDKLRVRNRHSKPEWHSSARSHPSRSSRRLVTSFEPRNIMTSDSSEAQPSSMTFCFRVQPKTLQPGFLLHPRLSPYIPSLLAAPSERQTEGGQDGTSERDCENSSLSVSSPSASEISTRIATCLPINPKPHRPIDFVSMTHVDENSMGVSSDQGFCLLPGEHCDRCGTEGVNPNYIDCKMAYELEGHLTKIKVCMSMEGYI